MTCKRCLIFLMLMAGTCARAGDAIQETPPVASAPLPDNVVAKINGQDIPADWFVHEFRSTYFRHQPSDHIQQVVFQPFLHRLLLAARARELHLDERPEIKAEIQRRITGMRAYMEYQLAMTEIGMLNAALVKELGIDTGLENVTDQEIAEYFERNIHGQPGAPETVAQISSDNLRNIKQQITQTRIEQDLLKRLEAWTADMSILINSNVVENVQAPEMKGSWPRGLDPVSGPAEP